MTEAHHPRLLRRAHQHGQLSGGDPETKQAAVVDPVLDYDHKSGKANVDLGRRHPRQGAEEGLHRSSSCSKPMSMPTISRARPTSSSRPAPRWRSASASRRCRRSSARCSTPSTSRAKARSSTCCSRTATRFTIGNLKGEVIATPGHTPACVSYRIGDAVFVGDTHVHARLRHGARRFSRRRCPHALPLHPPPDGAARARRACSCATTTCPRTAARTTPGRPRWPRNSARNVHVHEGIARGRLREDAHHARCDALRPHAAHAVDPGQHARRQAAAGGRQRRPLSPGADHAPEVSCAREHSGVCAYTLERARQGLNTGSHECRHPASPGSANDRSC